MVTWPLFRGRPLFRGGHYWGVSLYWKLYTHNITFIEKRFFFSFFLSFFCVCIQRLEKKLMKCNTGVTLCVFILYILLLLSYFGCSLYILALYYSHSILTIQLSHIYCIYSVLLLYWQVKLAHQESELAALLKRIPLGQPELNVIRDRAERLRDGKLKLRGEALLPLTLASFIFDSLSLPGGSLSKFSSHIRDGHIFSYSHIHVLVRVVFSSFMMKWHRKSLL